jgi:glycosyltransferase involved in cell wall biosynthesis
MTVSDLVSVVIPAYNAASTLDETMRSVRSQTHRALEILVVDDGSTDATRSIAERHAAADRRVLVLSQHNAGVAAARNAGWRRAQSDLVAFVDADDLWAPTKIEQQVRVLRERGPRFGLAYCGSVQIDANGHITQVLTMPSDEGDVLGRIVESNFVGNGSAALIRRQALIDADGFEPSLRAAGAEGCEDFLLYCRIAERYHFACVRESLVGYRNLDGSMSKNRVCMLRSWALVHDEVVARHPEHRDALDRGFVAYGRSLARETLSLDGIAELSPIVRLLLARSPPTAMEIVLADLPRAGLRFARNRLRRLAHGSPRPASSNALPRFPVGDPD